jgi:hypothetical protein
MFAGGRGGVNSRGGEVTVGEGQSAGEEGPVGELMEILTMIKVLGIQGQTVLVWLVMGRDAVMGRG